VSDTPDFRELVGTDLSEEERARLGRVHELLVAAGPPPELPPELLEPDLDPRESVVSFLPRRRAGFVLGIAAAVGIAAFLGGFVAGRAKDPFPRTFELQMKGTGPAAAASATLQVGKADEVGNWPLKLIVRGLPRLPKGAYYEMFLTRNHRPAATCGTFRVKDTSTTVRLNAPYHLRSYDGWVVTREGPDSTHPVVLST
jgi:hypothetical protein